MGRAGAVAWTGATGASGVVGHVDRGRGWVVFGASGVCVGGRKGV